MSAWTLRGVVSMSTRDAQWYSSNRELHESRTGDISAIIVNHWAHTCFTAPSDLCSRHSNASSFSAMPNLQAKLNKPTTSYKKGKLLWIANNRNFGVGQPQCWANRKISYTSFRNIDYRVALQFAENVRRAASQKSDKVDQSDERARLKLIFSESRAGGLWAGSRLHQSHFYSSLLFSFKTSSFSTNYHYRRFIPATVTAYHIKHPQSITHVNRKKYWHLEEPFLSSNLVQISSQKVTFWIPPSSKS